MDIVYLVLRGLLLTLGIIIVVIHMALQLYRGLPSKPFSFKAYDWAAIGITSFLFGIGCNSYWGLLAGLVPGLWKVGCGIFLQAPKLKGSGRWMEVRWQKMTPKGFNLPREMMAELSRLPTDKHFLVPRFVSLLFIRYFMKNMKSNASKQFANLPKKGKGQEAQALGMIEDMVSNIAKLEGGRTEQVSLPFGVLKVTRL